MCGGLHDMDPVQPPKVDGSPCSSLSTHREKVGRWGMLGPQRLFQAMPKGCWMNWCRVAAVTTPVRGRMSALCQNETIPKAAPRRSSVSGVIQKGRVSPLYTGPPSQGREPGQCQLQTQPGTGEAGRPRGSSPPDVPPAFRCGDGRNSSQGPRWAALTWEQALQSPDALCLAG